jgi:SAM-dependent methyltransferase
VTANRLPALVDAHLAETADDLPFWECLAAAHGGDVLELGCGTGRIVRALATRGCSVTGIDIDPDALSFARSSLSESIRPRVRLLEADMRTLDLGRTFRLVLAACNTLASLPDDDLAQALRRACFHLSEEGCFAAEVPVPQDVHDDAGDDILAEFHDPELGAPVQVSAQQSAAARCGPLRVEWRYDTLLPDGRVERTSFSTTYYLRTPDLLRRVALEAGFTQVDLQGDDAGGPWSPGSPRLILLARRTPAPGEAGAGRTAGGQRPPAR